MKTNFLIIPILFLLSGIPAFAQTDTTALDRKDCYITDVREKLIGQTPGVIAVSSVGTPGMTPSVYIHGFHRYAKNPAFFVDGVRVEDLDFLAPESIADIQVLSGSEAILRYGPEASCGALVVTTRNATQKGFHASYSFAGAIHQLAWEPQQITLQEWQAFNPYLENYTQNPHNLDRIGTSFAQTHHLGLQSKTDKLNVAANLDFLDNDGPLEGRVDSHRRFSGTARIGYRPLEWLNVEFSAAAGKSDKTYQDALMTILYNQPVRPEYEPWDPLDKQSVHKLGKTAFSAQGKVEFRPLDGLYARAFYGISQDKDEDETREWKWHQFGLDLGYSRTFGKHAVGLDATVKRQGYFTHNRFNTMVREIYLSSRDTLTDLAVRLHYDWNKRLSADFGLYKRYYKSHRDEWLKKPAFAASLRWKPGERWEVFGSWSHSFHFVNTGDVFSLQDPLISIITTAAYSRLNAGAEADFRIGGSAVHARINGFLDRDNYYSRLNMDDMISVRNLGLELAADWNYAVDDFVFCVEPSLTLYRNKVTNLSGYITNYFINTGMIVQEGDPVGIAWLYPVTGVNPDNNDPIMGQERQTYGNGLFPTAVLGLHGSVSWNNWQLNILGHGNFGQSVMHTVDWDCLRRHFITDQTYHYYSGSDSYRESSAMLFDASFFRIDQIRLDYTLPLKAFNMDLFASLENFILFTRYPGSDPEYTLQWENAGTELSAVPSTRRVVFGVKIAL